MNAHTQNQSVNGSIVTAVGVLVLLVGTASGNAAAMLALSVIALAGITLFHRWQPGRTTWLVMLLSATVAVLTAFAVAAVR